MGVICYHSTKVRLKALSKGDRVPIVPQFRGGKHHNYDAVLDAVGKLDETEVPDPIS